MGKATMDGGVRGVEGIFKMQRMVGMRQSTQKNVCSATSL